MGANYSQLAKALPEMGKAPAASQLPVPARTGPPVALVNLGGGGIYFWWMAGAIRELGEACITTNCRMRGASAGALAAVLGTCGVCMDKALDLANDLSRRHGVFERPLGLLGVWGGIIREWLFELLPDDAAERCSGKVEIVMTSLPSLRRQSVTTFSSKQDVIEACCASAHVPFVLDGNLAAKYRGQPVVDGALLDAVWQVGTLPVDLISGWFRIGRNIAMHPGGMVSADGAVDLSYRHDDELRRRGSPVADKLAGRDDPPLLPLAASGNDPSASSPAQQRAAFSVEAPLPSTLPGVEERNNLKRRGDRNSNRGRVAFATSATDLQTGASEPLRTESQQDLKRRTLFSSFSGDNSNGMESAWSYNAPIGHRVLEGCTRGGRGLSLRANRMLVLVLTFLCYMAYHASRKPPSIVKSVLNGEGNGDAATFIGGHRRSTLEIVGRSLLADVEKHKNSSGGGGDVGPGWAPFNSPKVGKALLGDLDLAFLGSYALGMFVSGHLGDRVDLRYFLTGGMLGSGICVMMFGAAYFFEIHTMGYFVTVQVVGGLLQATGWPSVVSVMANWFGQGKRGLIMGIWNAHTSIGNIVGSLMAAYMLKYGWGWSFVVPGALIAVIGVFIFLFLVVEPQDIGFLPQSGSNLGSLVPSQSDTPRSVTNGASGGGMSEGEREFLERRIAQLAEEHGGMVPARVAASMEAHHHVRPAAGRHGMMAMGSTLVLMNKRRDSEDGSEDGDREALLGVSPGGTLLTPNGGERVKGSVSFLAAWCIPGVAVYALTLFFAKLVAYTFLYWLPYYINATEVGGRSLTPTEAGNLSILFDVGGVMGGVLAGYLSDASGAPAVVSCSFVYMAIPVLYLYRAYGEMSWLLNISLMMTAGFFVNGPYALITTAVSADLGSSSMGGNEKALATVTAIIDGMGSIGAALGPMVTGYISELPGGFDNVFLMLYGAALCAGLLLSGLVLKELSEMLGFKADAGRRKSSGGRDGLLGSSDVLNSAPFSYLPPGESADEYLTIDNESGAAQRLGGAPFPRE